MIFKYVLISWIWIPQPILNLVSRISTNLLNQSEKVLCVCLFFCLLAKGQIISKAIFVLSNFSKKTNENDLTSYFIVLWYNKSNQFRSFFGRIQDTIICFRDYLTFRISEEHNIFHKKNRRSKNRVNRGYLVKVR